MMSAKRTRKQNTVHRLLSTLCTLMIASVPAAAQEYREELDLGTPPPEEALVLFDGSEESLLDNWRMWPDENQAVQWRIMPDPVDEGTTMMSCCANGYGKQDLITKQTFTDFEGHVEFIMMGERGDNSPDGYSNSGVYLQNRHEIQIETLRNPEEGSDGKHDIGSICKDRIPDYTLWREQGDWQSFHFIFRAAQWSGKTMVEKARVTVWWNGVRVHDDVEVMFAKGGVEVGPEPQGLKLQEHGTDVRFRNVWIKETGQTNTSITDPKHRIGNHTQRSSVLPSKPFIYDMKGRILPWKDFFEPSPGGVYFFNRQLRLGEVTRSRHKN